MSFLVRCHVCSQKMQVTDKARGTTGRCPWCKTFLTLEPADENSKGSALSEEEAAKQQMLAAAAKDREAPVRTREAPGRLDAPPVDSRRWIEPVGGAGLLACGAAFLCASFASMSDSLSVLTMGVLPLAIVGLLLGLVSCLRLFAEEEVFRPPLPVGSAVVGSLLLLVALMLPALLGPAYEASKIARGAVESGEIRALSQKGDADPLPAWADAPDTVLQLGPLRVQVISAYVGPTAVPPKQPAPKSKQPVEQSLFVVVRTTELAGAKGLAWGAATGDAANRPRLTDQRDKEYRFRDLRQSRPEGRDFPTALTDVIFVFEPPGDVEELRLELPAAPLGASGQFRFRIPASMIRRDQKSTPKGEMP